MTAQPSIPNPRKNLGDEMLTLDETAAMLRLPENTLRYWRVTGAAPGASRSVVTSATGEPTSSSGSPSRPTAHSTSESIGVRRRTGAS